jgi:hypothetical protein
MRATMVPVVAPTLNDCEFVLNAGAEVTRAVRVFRVIDPFVPRDSTL